MSTVMDAERIFDELRQAQRAVHAAVAAELPAGSAPVSSKEARA